MVITMAKEANPTVGGGLKKPAPIKVKQDMIDFIKTQGMTRALKRAGSISAKGTKGEAEFLEGVKRMYGANRLAKATAMAKPAAKSADAARGAYANKAAGNYTAKSKTQPKPKTAAYAKGEKPVLSKAPAKKKNSSLPLKITGGALAGAALIASRGKATGLAAKLSPGIAKSGVGKALGMAAKNSPKNASNVMAKKISSVREAAATKAASAAGRANAKAKRPVSQTQYDAMKAQAAKAKPKTMKKKAAAGAGVGSMTLKGDTAKPKKK